MKHNKTITINQSIIHGIKETDLADEKPRGLYCSGKKIFWGNSYHMDTVPSQNKVPNNLRNVKLNLKHIKSRNSQGNLKEDKS